MAIFRRKKDESVLPEVDKYYEGERRDRPVMAWLLALLSIAVVALVIVGLFLGGRWAYNKIANNDDEEIATTSDSGAPTFDGAPENTGENQGDTNTNQPSTPAPSDPNSAQNGTTTNGSPNTPAQNPPTTSTGSPLPNTGPEGVVAAFVLTSSIAGGTHYLLQHRKFNQ